MSDERIEFDLVIATGEDVRLGICRNEPTTLHLTRGMAELVSIVQRQRSSLAVKRSAVFPEEL